MTSTLLVALLIAYVAGSIPTSFIVGRLGGGLDLREHGSGNLGATNTFRVLGWQWAVPVAVLDAAKGALPVRFLSATVGDAPWIPVAIGTAAIVGHVFSVFMRFRGGKGVATAAGVVLALAPLALLASLVLWLVVLRATGYVSLSSMTAALAFPLLAWWLGASNQHVVAVGVVLALFIVFTHRSNIGRLLAGTENRFGRRRTA